MTFENISNAELIERVENLKCWMAMYVDKETFRKDEMLSILTEVTHRLKIDNSMRIDFNDEIYDI